MKKTNLIVLLAQIIEAIASYAHNVATLFMTNSTTPALVPVTIESYSWDDEEDDEDDEDEDEDDDLDMDWDDEEDDEDDDYEDDEEEEDDEY